MKSESEPKGKQLSKRKSFLFKIGAFLFAVLILVALEGGLRLAGYGTDYDLFIDDGRDISSLMMNPQVSEKYFSDIETATSGIPKSFLKEKDPNTLRIFILGASTGIGYPYRYNGGFHHWLEYGLNRSFPDKKFEVINLSLTAINSYTLLDFTKQLVDYSPDAVLIYAGHNEFYGALGVASTNSMGKNPWMVNTFIKLKTLRTTQLISNTISAIRKKSNKDIVANETLMKKMVQDQKIPLDSELFNQGMFQFESNLDDILELLDEHSVPTFISTIVSNIKDVKPFISDSSEVSTSAQFWYDKAKNAYAANDFGDAKADFKKAKELDMLRFRAPEKVNVIIEELALKHKNVILVTSHKEFENQSPNTIVGNELLLEHVHPNIKGYAVLGYSFYNALINAPILKNGNKYIFDFAELWQQMPITVLDSVTGNYEILMLMEGWPYYEPMPPVQTDSLTIPEIIAGRLAIQKISWDDASQALFRHYLDTNDDENALKVIEAVALTYPNDSKYYEKAAELAAKLNQSEKTSYLYQKAFSIDKSMEMAKRISRNLIENGLFQESLPYLESVKKAEPENAFASQLYDISKKIVSLKDQENDIKNNPDIGIELAENFSLIGNTDKALLYLKTVVMHHPNNEKALQMLKKIQ